MLKEFKEFALKGNIMDLAIGVVIGGAFQKIVNSLVNDIIMPVISILTGNIDFSDMVFTVGGASITYGNFITTIVDFLIIAFSIFMVVKYLNKLNKLKDLGKKEIEAQLVIPETKICPFCLTDIKYYATRCPHCTSELPKEVKKE